MIRERLRPGLPGLPVLAFLLVLIVTIVVLTIWTAEIGRPPFAFLVGIPIVLFVVRGFIMVAPNEAVVLQLFGAYAGTGKVPGLRWTNPFYARKRISLRVRNFESPHLKVNDADGNPIEIGAVVVWKVFETAEATFEVDDYQNYVRVQSEAAIRNAATSYPYDAHDDSIVSLRGATSVVADHMKQEVQQRLQKAGVDVVEARISHLAYAPEIAAAMLQRQQAGAIIAARTRIVEGAVGMVEMALEMLSHKAIVVLDEERKAAMVSNLLVVLCGERGAQPVLNTGTIHQ
jgi:regulator of protease activity HflC (stomatin/prohibitin superfamily)